MRSRLDEQEKENDKLYEASWKSNFISGLMHPIMNFIGNIGYVVVAILGGYYAIKGKITVGNIQSFISYNKQFTQPIGQVAQVANMIQSMIASSERIFNFLDLEEDDFSGKTINAEDVNGDVEFKLWNINNANTSLQIEVETSWQSCCAD